MIRLTAPAKVNLFLAVRGVRPDGYHQLETIFQAIDLTDEIELDLLPEGIRVSSDHPDLPIGEENLCRRAAALLQQRMASQKGVEIRLTKQIPIGAGLGGGSSNAAAVLRGLSRLWELDLKEHALQQLGASLGADVAFFLRGGTALGRGRGEFLSPLPTPRLWLVIAWPKVALSTRLVYQAWDEQPSYGAVELAELAQAIEADDPARIAGALRNDLEAATLRLCPACGELKRRLLAAGALGAMVSGSGSAVFGIAESASEAAEVAGRLAGEDVWVRVAKTTPAANLKLDG